jgi:hypothetical protein
MDTTHITQKNPNGTELISTVGSLHINSFLLHTNSFQPVVQGGIVYRKKTSFQLLQYEEGEGRGSNSKHMCKAWMEMTEIRS